MSSQRGNVKKRAPKHQNTFAFKHNPKSKKTDRILSMPIHGLCEKCRKQIEWRKKYRKYKPLTQPGSCIYCHQKTVTSAYHASCDPCAKERDICAKCCLTKEIVASEQELLAEHEKKEREFENTLEGMRERDRRAYLRKLEKEKEAITNGEGADSAEVNGYESYDEEDEDMQ
ncbi:hypothetical protein F441_09483 [Phytophthora nicotianae CJ01A1]|uniref:Uncharacterized protein n=5 Tax=Phytophthora nicotianae TaxID=4792 RepID=W2Q4P7_PHYN3|nr:hypothetical protein PPTG_12019 [Phytophthora nicotianae INRA-310]ETI46031.1 hypothetical protein F443_09550 [Phytophthora nicotianae P1569]ETK85997.1 hypothetical protein L915_09344 [Phytophthora nicotianae]ETP15864.1 hypothetical protein F441_09483 [Phytophthora nicotianae CJ01A1]ETP43917.1 hypothetical protein F442_09457 [Phytophthora nicotianae P10297]KUG01889.1 hypothetical protein AM587_10010604 [Phytophthora nicotianae]